MYIVSPNNIRICTFDIKFTEFIITFCAIIVKILLQYITFVNVVLHRR